MEVRPDVPGDEPTRSPSPLRALARGLARSSWALVLAVGWLTLLGQSALLVAEASGLIHARIEEELARELAALGGTLSIEGSDLHWTRRSATLHGVELVRGSREVRLERVDVRFGWREPRGPVIEHLAVSGGELTITDELTSGVQSLFQSSGEDPSDAVVVVRDIDVSLKAPHGGLFPVGRVDALVMPDRWGQPVLHGALVTAFADAAGERGTIRLRGRLREDRLLEVSASGRRIAIDTAYLPRGGVWDRVHEVAPRGGLDVFARAQYEVGRSIYPQVDARIQVAGVELRLPHVQDPQKAVLQDGRADARVRYRPRTARGEELGPFELDAWSGRAQLSTTWLGQRADAWLRIGGETGRTTRAELWLDVPRLELGPDVLELCGRPELLVDEVWPLLQPGGTSRLLAAVRVPRHWSLAEGDPSALELALALLPDGGMSGAYHGSRRREGLEPVGFPMRLEKARGAGVVVRRETATVAGIFGLQAQHGSGEARLDLAAFVPDPQPGETHRPEDYELYLHVRSAALAVDEKLEAAAAGLSRIVPPERLWQRIGPTGGEVSFDFELWKPLSIRALGTRLSIDLRAGSFVLRDLPIPVRNATGHYELWTDALPADSGGGHWGHSISLRGESEAARDGIVAEARVQSDASRTADHRLTYARVQAGGVNLRHGKLREICQGAWPELSKWLADSGAAGFVDIGLRHVGESGSAAHTELAIAPEGKGLSLLPPRFPMPTSGIQGRLLATAEIPPGNGEPAPTLFRARFEPIVGHWRTEGVEIPLALRGEMDERGRGHLDIAGGGVDMSSEALLSSLSAALTGGREPRSELAVGGLGFQGFVDFEAALELGGDQAADLRARLRDVLVLRGDEPLLSHLNGQLVYGDGRLSGERLRATFGRTPVELRALTLTAKDDGMELQARLAADSVPLDAEHLERFLDEATLRALEELQWRGTVDLEDVALTLRTHAGRPSTVQLDGELRIADVNLQLGLPLSIRSGIARDVHFLFDGERVRGWTEISEVYAQLDGRRLDDASMVLSYVDPRLTIERFDGRFEGGRLMSLGSAEAYGAGFLTVDLEPPYPFGVSIELERVDVAGLLRGIFNSDFAAEGLFSATLRLNGDTEHLNGMRGVGRVQVEDSSLWSIPAFQALFSQLGFDSTATFDEMDTRLVIDEGVVHMKDMRARSPLLHLVGEGSVDVDGSMEHELEVRYSLVDKLGPLTVLLYRLQNSLLRVRIGGTLARPEVELRGFLSGFLSSRGDRRRDLPLPGVSPLPERF